ncbi:MAG: ABC transporter substrate-binding protein [Deltaproteobacteria bacterium]|nr:ABC transporter substrate-binding protein [Deltaproteobacteria bacterium]
MTSRHAAILLLLVLVFVVQAVDAAGIKSYGGTLHLSAGGDLSSTDPAKVDSIAAWELGRQVHETLFRMTPEGLIMPSLAHELPAVSDDGKLWTIKLRPGLRFHDGSTIDSQAVLMSWQRLLDAKTASPHWWLLAPVRGAVAFHAGKLTKLSGVEIVNSLEFRIRLKHPMPAFVEALSALPTAPLSRRTLRAEGGVPVHPSGSGPFMFSEETTDLPLRLVPFLRHARGRPFLDYLVLMRFVSPREALLAFELGKLHLVPFPPKLIDSRLRMVDTAINRMVFLVMNKDHLNQLPAGFFEVVNHVLDRRALVAYMVGERGRPMDELIRLDDTGQLQGKRVEVLEAKAYVQRMLIQRVGIAPVFEFIISATDPFARGLAERIQLNLQDVGMSVQIIELSHDELRTRIAKGQYDFRLERPLPLVQDPLLQLLSFLGRLSDSAELEDALDALMLVPDSTSRVGVARERARRKMIDLSWVPLMVHSDRLYVRNAVHDLRPDRHGVIDFADVWLEE